MRRSSPVLGQGQGFVIIFLVSLLSSTTSGSSASSEEAPFTAPPLDPACTFNVTVNHVRGYLASPGYPNEYPSNSHCRWNLNAEHGNITLVFRKFDIESNVGCSYDHLRVTKGNGEKIGRYCGSSIEDGDSIPVNDSSAVLEFVSDSSFNGVGFKLEYFTNAVENPSKDTACNSKLTAQSGRLTSPGYPVGYSANENCETLITVRTGYVIALRFDDISLEYSTNGGDFVEIFDGSSTDFPSLGKWTRKSELREIISTTNNLVVAFASDDQLQDHGYSAWYEARKPAIDISMDGPCYVNKTSSRGIITSPNFPKKYSPDQRCVAVLNATESQRVQISFEYFLLEKSPSCSADYLEVYDKQPKENAVGNGWHLLYKLCGDGVPQKILVSSSNELRLEFVSDGFSEVRGFKIVYEVISPTVEKSITPVVVAPIVTVSPETLFAQVFPANQTSLTEGDDYALDCSPRNVNAKLTWYKDDIQLRTDQGNLIPVEFPSSNVLYIKKLDVSTAGRYTCEIEFQNKRTDMSINIIKQKPTAVKQCNITVRALKEVNSQSGGSPYFTCQARFRAPKRSPLTYQWLRNYQDIPKNNSRVKTTIGHGIYISEAVWTDSGVYTCIVTDTVNECSVKTSGVLKVQPRNDIKSICGKPKFTSNQPIRTDGKIIAGTVARKGAHPWMAMLHSPKKKTFCGGALLNNEWVLTAAHCLFNFDESIQNISVLLGKLDQTLVEESEIARYISKQIIHPDFNPKTYDSDLALIKLNKRVEFTDYILPICLGDTDFVRQTFFNYKDLRYGTVAGWGKLSERGGQPRFLQEIKLPLVNPETCKGSTTHAVTANMFCAGYNQDIIGDACKGDSGGSFIVEDENRWYAIGVVSWGVGCGRAGNYGFYIKLDNYHDWIKERIS